MRTPAALVLCFCALVLPCFARGDKLIPVVADGVTGDGTAFRTKIDVINLGPFDAITTDKLRILFFLQNGSPWSVVTNRGTGSEFPLSLAPFETLRIETAGTAPLTTGYAIVRNTASDGQVPNFAEDFEASASVFYEIRRGGSVVDTVSVPVGQPTVHWQLPVENDLASNLLSGLAIANLADSTNRVTLKLFRGSSPSYQNPDATVSVSLNPREQISRFLVDPSLFPGFGTFRGSLEGAAEKPVAVLALLQTPTPGGLQYATLAPAYIDSLRRNTYMYLRQGFPLDADIPVSDYFADITSAGQDTTAWDLVYEPPTGSSRRLSPRPGAQFAIIGVLDSTDFDNLSLDTLRGLSYSSDSIDMSDKAVNSRSNLVMNFAFAVKTGLGRYVKLHLVDIINSGTEAFLAFEVYVFK